MISLYSYKAIDDNGRHVSGRVRRSSELEALSYLRAKGWYPVSITRHGSLAANLLEGRSGTKEELALLCRQLSFFLESGIDTAYAFELSLDQGKTSLQARLKEIHLRMQKGEALSSCAEENFPTFMTEAIRIGEASGRLGEVFGALADYYEQSHKTIQAVKSALAYPIVVTSLLVLVAIGSLVYVVPAYSDMYASYDAELPGSTQALINLSSFVLDNKVTILAMIFLLAGFFYLGRKKLKEHFDGLALRLPVMKHVFIKYLNLRFVQSLNLLLSTGLSIPEAIDIASNALSNSYAKKNIRTGFLTLQQGTSLSRIFSLTGFFEPVVVSMVRVGEETGRLPDVLSRTATHLQSEMERFTQNLSRIIEPVITLALGIFLAFIMLALMLPAYELANII